MGPDAADEGPLLSIGVFARRSRLSAKAIRLYDRLGLLRPRHVDAANGYRWYGESQLATARLIAMLRRLDMPLDRIAAVLAADGPGGAGVIASYWDDVERRSASRRELARYLAARLRGDCGGADGLVVREREVPEQRVLTELRRVRVPELAGWLQTTIPAMTAAAAARGGVAGHAFVVFHGAVDEDGDGPVEVCVPISAAVAASAHAVRAEPAHREAYVTLVAAQVEFPQILSAYDIVARWVVARSHTVAGAPREVYLPGAAAPPTPATPICEVAFPFR